jgi:hypothetical protein
MISLTGAAFFDPIRDIYEVGEETGPDQMLEECGKLTPVFRLSPYTPSANF